MSDLIDAAQDLHEVQRETALARHRSAVALSAAIPHTEGICIDCAEAIEAARMRATGKSALRCLDCQQAAEARRT